MLAKLQLSEHKCSGAIAAEIPCYLCDHFPDIMYLINPAPEVCDMELIQIKEEHAEYIAPLIADFRVTLNSYRGIESTADIESAREELRDFLDAGYPVFAAVNGDEYAGYIVCRIEEPILWAEQFYVRKEYRRQGIASLLFAKAEEIAASMGEDTVFNFVHPNNEGMIAFLRSKGYTVLNMIEIRKPYKNEKLTAKIRVNDNVFDY